MALISRTYGKILAIIMTWLGFSCKTEDNINIIACEYGVPSATYKAKGVVVSQTNDAPIEGIRAVLKARKDFGIDTVYTDSKGVFNLKSREREFDFDKLYVELTDVDGDKNGSFNDMEVEADYSNATFTGGDKHWDRGEAEKDLGIIKLQLKE